MLSGITLAIEGDSMRSPVFVLAAVTLLSSTSRSANPTLRVTAPPATTSLSARLVAPDGTTVWSCDQRPSAADNLVACPEVAGWWRGEGTYVLVTSTKATGRTPSLLTIDVPVFGDDTSLHVRLASEPRETSIVRALPAGVRLDLNKDRPFEADLVNDSTRPVYGSLETSSPLARLERRTDTGWDVVGRDGTDRLTSLTRYASGSRTRFSVPFDQEELLRLGQGTYRIVVGGGFEDNPESDDRRRLRPASRFTVASEPFDWPPKTSPLACGQPWHRRVAQPEGRPADYQQLVRTARGLLLVTGAGELIELEKEGYPLLSKIPAGTRLVRSEDPAYLIYAGPQFGASHDGGATWTPLGGPALPRHSTIALVGQRIVQVSNEGGAYWRESDGTLTEIPLPDRAAWRNVVFRDALHGILIGDCNLLLETEDGGKTWSRKTQPRIFLEEAAWVGNEFVLAGSGGVFRRRADQTPFERMIESKVCVTSHGSQPFAASCVGMDVQAPAVILVFQADDKPRRIQIEDGFPFAMPFAIEVATDGRIFTLGLLGVTQYLPNGERQRIFESSFSTSQTYWRDMERRMREGRTPTKQ